MADILSRMFCGWQLYPDFNDLAILGSGKLEINALDGKCRFNEKGIKKLSIARVLESWVNDELLSNNIPISAVDEALLKVDVLVTTPPHGNRFTYFEFSCQSSIRSETDLYTNRFRDEQSYECKNAT
jgi:hypothetical protein